MASRLPVRLLVRQLGPFLVLGVAILAMDPRREWVAVLLNPPLFIAMVFAFTALHEAGHALAAAAVGMSVWRVHLGFGHLLKKWKVGVVEVRLGTVPLGGATLVMPRQRHGLRTRFWLVIAAGPLVNAAMVALLWPLQSATPSRAVAPIALAFGANVLLLLGSLLPIKMSSALGVSETDGRQLLTIPFLPDSFFDELTTLPEVARCEEARERRDYDAALRICERGLELTPKSVALMNSKAVVLIELSLFAEARELLYQLVNRSDVPRRFVPLSNNNLAWTDAMLGEPRWMSEADELSRAVLRETPRAAWANGTRGAVLVRLGKARPAIEKLVRAWELNQLPQSRAHNAAWLAAAHAQLGDPRAAREWWDRAMALDPECSSLPIVKELTGF